MLHIKDGNGNSSHWMIGDPVPKIFGTTASFEASLGELDLFLKAMSNTENQPPATASSYVRRDRFDSALSELAAMRKYAVDAYTLLSNILHKTGVYSSDSISKNLKAAPESVKQEQLPNARPCAYCSHNFSALEKLVTGIDWWYVRCQNFACRATGPQKPSQKDAIVAWNR